MEKTSNYRKYNSSNPIQKYLIGNFQRVLLSCLTNLNIDKVLDAGCGEGFVLSLIKKNHIGTYLEGIDSSQEALDIGREIFPFFVLNHGDIYRLPYDNDFFDLVICTEVMEHLENPEKVLEEIIRVSKKYCLLSVPNEPFFKIANFMRGKNLSRWGEDIDHVQNWNSEQFVHFIHKKLDILKVKKPFPWTVVLSKKA